MSECQFKLIKNIKTTPYDPNKIKEENVYDFLIIKTGYTSRLLKKERLNYIKEIYNERYNEDFEVVYIYDNIWGEGLYFNDKFDLKIAEEILNLEESYGTICFIGKFTQFNAINIGELLKDVDYCANFGLCGLRDYKLVDTKSVLLLEYDTESG